MRDEPLVALAKSQQWKPWLGALAIVGVGACHVWPAALAIFFGTSVTLPT